MAKLAGWQWARDTFAGLVHGHRHSADGPDPIRPADIGAVVDGDVAGTLRSVSGGSDTAFGGNTGVTIGQALQALSQDIGDELGATSMIKVGGSAPAAGWWLDSGAPEYDPIAPSAPTGVTATATGSTTISLSWVASTDNIGVTGYEYRIGSGSAIDAGAGTTEDVSGLTASTPFSFSVRSYDAAGNRSPWSTPASATTLAGPDVTPPTPGALTASAITQSSFTLTVTGASDAGAGLHAQPYRFSFDNGTTWSAWQASADFDVSGRTTSTAYTCLHGVRDAAGNESVGSGILVTTADPAPIFTDSFTAPDGTSLVGRTVDGLTWQADTTKMTHLGAPGVSGTIQDGKVVSSAVSRTTAVIDTGINKARVSFDYALPTTGSAEFRFVAAASAPEGDDGINGFRFSATSSGSVTFAIGHGRSPFTLGSLTGQSPSGTIVIEYDQTQVTAYRNGVQFATTSFPDVNALPQPSGTHVGYTFSNHAGSSLDNLTITSL